MRQQVNLYQPIFRKQKKKFSAMAMVQAMALIIGAVILLYGYTQWRVGDMRQELTRIDGQVAAASKRLEEATQKFGRSPKQTLDAEISDLEARIAALRQVQQILRSGTFSNTNGFSPYFTAFARQHMPGIWLTGFDITGAAEQMVMKGRTVDPEIVPRYVQRLSKESVLDGIEFKVFRMARPEPGAAKRNSTHIEFVLTTAGTVAPEQVAR